MRVPSAMPIRQASIAGASWPAPSDKVAGLSSNVLTTSAPSGPQRR